MTNSAAHTRYQRQLQLKALGVIGQQKLAKAKVLVVGAGGLGSPVIQYLAGAGVGTIGIADYDTVAIHNLHRQTIYTMSDVGTAKVTAAAAFIHRLNPEINAIAHHTQLTAQNALGIAAQYDIVVDGTDNFATRYLINDACILLGKPLIFGAVSAFEIQLAVFNCEEKSGKRSVNYRDLFPTPPAENEVPNCNESGVLGVVPGLAGMWMASECIKLITGMGEPLVNQMLVYNVLNHQTVTLQFSENKNSRSLIPDSRSAFEKTNCQQLCGGSIESFEIDTEAFNALLEEETSIIDVREPGEMPVVTDFLCRNIPLQQLKEQAHTLQQKKIVLFCQSGKRSRVAARMLKDILGESREIYSLKGGIIARQTTA